MEWKAEKLNLEIYSLVVCVSNEFISSFAFDVRFYTAAADADDVALATQMRVFIFMCIDLNNLSYYMRIAYIYIDISMESMLFYFRLCATNEAKRHDTTMCACARLGNQFISRWLLLLFLQILCHWLVKTCLSESVTM